MADPSTFGQKFSNSSEPNSIAYRRVYDRLSSQKAIKELAYKAYIVAGENTYQGEPGVVIDAWLPETLSADINASYEAPFAQGLNQLSPNLGAIARFMGINLTTQALTAQIWQGGGFIEFSVPFIFHVETDAAVDVMEPIKKLFSLTLPKDPDGGGLLQAPGPVIDINRLAATGGEQFKESFVKLKESLVDSASSIPSSLSDMASSAVANLSKLDSKVLSTANVAAKAVSTSIVSSVKNNISLYLGEFLYFPSVVITDVNPTYDVVLSVDKNPIRATVNVNFRTFYTPTDRDIEIMFPATAHLRKQAYSKS